MKMKMVTALFVLSLGTTASFAQTGASDGSRFQGRLYSLDERIYRSPQSSSKYLY